MHKHRRLIRHYWQTWEEGWINEKRFIVQQRLSTQQETSSVVPTIFFIHFHFLFFFTYSSFDRPLTQPTCGKITNFIKLEKTIELTIELVLLEFVSLWVLIFFICFPSLFSWFFVRTLTRSIHGKFQFFYIKITDSNKLQCTTTIK